VDEATEEKLYTLLQERLPGLTMISVAHRATVAKFHHRRLTLQPETRSIEGRRGVTCPLLWPGTVAVEEPLLATDGGFVFLRK